MKIWMPVLLLAASACAHTLTQGTCPPEREVDQAQEVAYQELCSGGRV